MGRPAVLVVDDDPGIRESFRLILEDHYDVVDVPDGPSALDVVHASQVDLVLLDIRLTGMDGIEVLERIKAIDEGIEVILVTAVKTVRTAVAAMKLGAFDYLTKPFEEDELLSLSRRALERRALEREVAFLRSELERAHDLDEIVGRHSAIEKLHGLIAQVARTSTTVLITGESGTGKELVARAIHHQGPRREGPFVAVNPAAIAESLIESDLFGHEKGAFTGAHQRKLGKFELAQGGTLFLDEIGTLRAELQAKLLRVLQEREIERVGGTRPVTIDVRFIAATNTNLKEAVGRVVAPAGHEGSGGRSPSAQRGHGSVRAADRPAGPRACRLEPDRGRTDSRDPSELAPCEARAMGHPGARATLIAQLLGAHWLGVPHNHCATRRCSPRSPAKHSPSRNNDLAENRRRGFLVAAELLPPFRGLVSGPSWGEPLTRRGGEQWRKCGPGLSWWLRSSRRSCWSRP